MTTSLPSDVASLQAARNGSLGRILKCETHSPASLEPTHPDLFWYGIHGVESLFTVMGTGCQSVSRSSEDGKIVVTGRWSDGRVVRGVEVFRAAYAAVGLGWLWWPTRLPGLRALADAAYRVFAARRYRRRMASGCRIPAGASKP